MDTKTEYRYSDSATDLCKCIDSMYSKYGKRVINVSTAKSNSYYYAFITILKEQQKNNID